MYHSHYDEMTQMALGMMGMFVIHPREPRGPAVDRDFAHHAAASGGSTRAPAGPNPNEMTDFNVLTMNAKAFPGTDAAGRASSGERVRIRLGNLSAMDHHPIHLHGYQFAITETDGGDDPEVGAVARRPRCWCRSAARATIEFVADEPGDWAMHCHMTHHVMNQMGHGIPNMIGVEPGGLDDEGAASCCPAT